MDAYLSRTVSVLEHTKSLLGKHEPKTYHCQRTCFRREARDEHRGQCDGFHRCGASTNISTKNDLKKLIKDANDLLDDSVTAEAHKVVLKSVIFPKLEKLINEVVKDNCEQNTYCLSQCFGGRCSDHRECGRKVDEWYNVKDGRCFARYAHATNCTRWSGWFGSCQGHVCCGYLVSSSDLNELIDVVNGLNTPSFLGIWHLDRCPEVLSVKDEEQGRMPEDPFPGAVNYIDENPEADVALAQKCAPLATQVENATEPAQEEHAFLEREAVISAVDSSDVAHSEASFVSAADDQRCFLEGTMLPDADGRLVRVEDLQLHHSVRATDGQIVRVVGVKHHVGPHQVVSLQSDDHVLRMTASHRVMVRRGSQQEPAPAKDLRVGEDVVCRSGILHLATMPVTMEEDIPAVELFFSPNLPVETFPAAPQNVVLTMGSRPPKRRRKHFEIGDADMVSIPATEDGFDGHM